MAIDARVIVNFGVVCAPLVQAFRKAAAAMRALGDAFYLMAERAYKEEKRRLPGSLKTKRLRKKRRKMVSDWFYKTTG